jgi:hypothetical protein
VHRAGRGTVRSVTRTRNIAASLGGSPACPEPQRHAGEARRDRGPAGPGGQWDFPAPAIQTLRHSATAITQVLHCPPGARKREVECRLGSSIVLNPADG